VRPPPDPSRPSTTGAGDARFYNPVGDANLPWGWGGFDSKLFTQLAKAYHITGGTPAALCQRNQEAADNAGQPQLALSWAIASVLLAQEPGAAVDDEDHFTCDGSKDPGCADSVVATSVPHFLDWCIMRGDVQTCAVLAAALGSPALEKMGVPPARSLQWAVEYCELLERLQLFAEAARYRKTSKLDHLREKSNKSTTVHTSCGSCGKPPGDQTGVVCSHCVSFTGHCSICHLPVRGLWAWCQGCAHGGHLEHMRAWFAENAVCPTGCNHRCDLRMPTPQ